MNRINLLGSIAACAVLAGCAGTSGGGSSSYGNGYDSSLNPPGSNLTKGTAGNSAIPNVAAWPVEDGKAATVRVIAMPSILFAPAKAGDANPYSGDKVDAMLKDVADMGFNVAKVWAFPSGRGIKLGKKGELDSFDESVTKNLADLAEHARANKIRLLVAFNDNMDGTGNVAVTDKKFAELYAKTIVAPVARKLKGNEGVFGFELMSQLEQQASTVSKSRGLDLLKPYLKTETDFIKKEDPERLVTAGPVSPALIQDGGMKDIGLDFYTIVVGLAPAPAMASLKFDRPVMVLLQADPEVKTDDAQSNAIKNFIMNADQGSYSGFVVSSYSTDDAASLLTKDGKHRPSVDVLKSAIGSTRK
ncbi:hypothetical protein BH11ARM1_BH11ARM1_00770 [soil metagenome]